MPTNEPAAAEHHVSQRCIQPISVRPWPTNETLAYLGPMHAHPGFTLHMDTAGHWPPLLPVRMYLNAVTRANCSQPLVPVEGYRRESSLGLTHFQPSRQHDSCSTRLRPAISVD
jgi:hypothetical protein